MIGSQPTASIHGRTRRRAAAAVGALTLTALVAACGQNGEGDDTGAAFPSRPIDLIVPFAAGGSADGTARQLAAAAGDTCGVPIIVRNETGGSGAVGFNAVISADPDGNTIGVAAVELSTLPHLGVVDITPDDYSGIMQYSEQPVAYAVPKNSPLNSFKDLLAVRHQINVATSGTGSIYHLGFAGMAQKAGIQQYAINVPFDGASSALQAALGGHTDMVTVGAAEMRSFVEGGELRALALAGDPVEYMADVPTLRSLGVDWEATAILGLIAPAGVPQDRITLLNECFNKARSSEQFTGYMSTLGLNSVYRDAAQFDAFMSQEYDRYEQVLRDAGIGVQP